MQILIISQIIAGLASLIPLYVSYYTWKDMSKQYKTEVSNESDELEDTDSVGSKLNTYKQMGLFENKFIILLMCFGSCHAANGSTIASVLSLSVGYVLLHLFDMKRSLM